MACDEWRMQIYLSWLPLTRVIVVEFTGIFQEGHISAYLFYIHDRKSGSLLLVIIHKEAQNIFIAIKDASDGSFSSLGFFRANKKSSVLEWWPHSHCKLSSRLRVKATRTSKDQHMSKSISMITLSMLVSASAVPRDKGILRYIKFITFYEIIYGWHT